MQMKSFQCSFSERDTERNASLRRWRGSFRSGFYTERLTFDARKQYAVITHTHSLCVSVLSLLHTSRTKIQAYKHQVQSEISEYDSKNGLSALCWSAQHNELERVQRASTDQALLNLRQDVWLVCCRNSPPSNPYIAHRTSWAIGWVCLENVTKIAGSAPPLPRTQQFFLVPQAKF
jgi:hypothetical protein